MLNKQPTNSSVIVPGFLITGGDRDGTVEIFSPGKTTTHCKIDPLPEEVEIKFLKLMNCQFYRKETITQLLIIKFVEALVMIGKLRIHGRPFTNFGFTTYILGKP